MSERIAVIGLGYVGLPLALAFAKKFPGCVGFDLKSERVAELKRGVDSNGEVDSQELQSSNLKFTSERSDLKGATFFVIGVPTPVDDNKKPDLNPMRVACEIAGGALSPGGVVVFESTVYPGVTEDFCGPILESVSGLKRGRDFRLAYSPERINPGDREHSLARVVKVVSGEDQETLERVAGVYSAVIEVGVFRATSIKVAEAAKVIENTQRDINIALMNELAIIFDRMGIRTRDVLDAAGTKWNFIKYSPGLVGGHCIGVDPFYLTTKAEQLGYHPQVILAGRRINDGMGSFVAQKMVKLLANAGVREKGARVGVLGLAFKENVSDVRNSRVPDIVAELKAFGITPLVHDPLVDAQMAQHEYGIELSNLENCISAVDGLILAVAHRHYLELPLKKLLGGIKKGGVFIDVKSAVAKESVPAGLVYWSL